MAAGERRAVSSPSPSVKAREEIPEGKTYLLVAAAGSGTRYGGRKVFERIGGKSVLQMAAEPFLETARPAGIAIVHSPGDEEAILDAFDDGFMDRLRKKGCRMILAAGGDTRQDSVRNGLESLSALMREDEAAHSVVLIHDGARPWASAALFAAVEAGARARGACIPVCDLTDTPKETDGKGVVTGHPGRARMKGAQTPQGFAFSRLLAAHRKALEEKWTSTDDSSLWDRYEGPVCCVEGERANRKITFREDLAAGETGRAGAAAAAPASTSTAAIRVGHGWDIHPLVPGRRLMLGGLHVEYPRGESGHSDGDVLWHAVIDAMLGAAGLGDIGERFPPSDAKWKDADSSRLAAAVAKEIEGSGWRVVNLDCTVIAQEPRLSPYKKAIGNSMAGVLGIDAGNVSVKAKTKEGFDSTGRGEAIEASAVVLLAAK